MTTLIFFGRYRIKDDDKSIGISFGSSISLVGISVAWGQMAINEAGVFRACDNEFGRQSSDR